MGSTQDEGNRLVELLKEQLADKGWRVADLARVIAANEGEDLDSERGRARVKAVHNNVSQILKRQRGLGEDYARKISKALGIDQVAMFQAAGLIDSTDKTDTVDEIALVEIYRALTADERDEMTIFGQGLIKKRKRKQARDT